MSTNLEILDSNSEDIELTGIKDLLNSLKKTVEKIEPSVTKAPYEKDGAIIFDYEKSGQKWEIVTRKEGNTYKVRVKMWTRLPNGKDGWQTQKNGNEETYNFTSKNLKGFKKELGGVLDKVIGTDRDKLPKAGGKVYNMLNEMKEGAENNETPKGLELDHGTYVYEVQSGDCESVIKQKLSNYAPLNYLKNMSSGISGFNFSSIPDKKLLPGLKIIVPKPDTERIKTISEFKSEQKSALNEMKNDATYGDYIKNLIKDYGENHIAKVMTAYAKSESCPEDYDDKVGKYSLFRYERHHQCPSYGYHHVLYEGSGLTAFNNTGITIGQSCNPKESGKLFLAFCIEKINGAQKEANRGYANFKKFFNMEDTERCAKWYNGADIKVYSNKLKKNFDKVNG